MSAAKAGPLRFLRRYGSGCRGRGRRGPPAGGPSPGFRAGGDLHGAGLEGVPAGASGEAVRDVPGRRRWWQRGVRSGGADPSRRRLRQRRGTGGAYEAGLGVGCLLPDAAAPARRWGSRAADPGFVPAVKPERV